MSIFFTIISFIVALGILITFHEFGHYLVARWNGVKVLRFSVGFGQPVFRRRLGKDQTEWVVAAIPLGGYVKMLDENEGKVDKEDLPRAFNRQPVGRRFAIVAAGPLANFLLAIVMYWLMFVLGVEGIKPTLGPVVPDTPVARANFEQGETIVRIENELTESWQDARWTLLRYAVERSSAVTVETVNQNGKINWRQLDLSGIHPDELEGNVLGIIGFSVYQPEIKPVIAEVMSGGAGERAGLRAGDEILAVDDRDVYSWIEFVPEVQKNPGRALVLDVLRNDHIITLTVTPDSVVENGKAVGRIGIMPLVDQSLFEEMRVTVTYPAGEAVMIAMNKTWETTVLTLSMLSKMITGDVSWKNVSGPISIADYAGQSAQMGLASYLAFLALISVSLGVLNLLPIPILDGGHLMYYVIEMIKGSPVSEKTMIIGQKVGLLMLFTLMTFAIYNDIHRLATG
ncbi:RIP metalloprotease RseP [Nitrosomonas sp.]|uniref:RIP metalloprotease RseP n=1 Tax=Nitrosomonas sp. TaxID=42353 RepID=UPI001E04200B|nr:RIP metalloprotease RseP [Nitrosomonas sp.]MCB1949508.1 RIP metalloprotease RseP [Nitrosomonas sp.]MCP5243760.1 RIP metalloprotease RseP [Burkholderiales bacterium]MCP5292835.1 RIP metalloprotease RseP [Burkholderiales bacterium]MDR4515096.1 RIP metalloprotease RseP [Nitrosomonas sp.]